MRPKFFTEVFPFDDIENPRRYRSLNVKWGGPNGMNYMVDVRLIEGRWDWEVWEHQTATNFKTRHRQGVSQSRWPRDAAGEALDAILRMVADHSSHEAMRIRREWGL